MTDTASAATAIPAAATQTAIPATTAPLNEAAGAAQGAISAAADMAPAVQGAASAAADVAPAAQSLTSAFIVDGTLNLLIAFSVVTWALILIKGVQHLRIALSNRAYGKQFWGAPDFQVASGLDASKGPIARVAGAGFTTLLEADDGTTTHDLEHSGDRQELLDRRLRQQMQKERGSLESGLAVLATIGSISPFVGLFGTVWGIMGALTSISKSGSASLEVVAGPIGEALVATAVGIAVAVPAVVAYNFFIRRNKVLWASLDDFALDFIHLAQKTSFLITRPAFNSGVLVRGGSVRKSAPKASIDDLNVEGAQI